MAVQLKLNASGLFGGLLDGLFNRINDTIQQATQGIKIAGLELEIEAGEEISRAIEQVKNAYEKELNLTIEKVSRAAKDAFDRLDSMVQRFEKGTAEEFQELMGQAQQLANSMPFAKTQPQLTRVQPRYLVIDDFAGSCFVLFKGNFFYSATPGFEPSFVFADKTCYLFDSNTQSLTFQVPQSAFKDVVHDRYAYKTGKLTIPWDKGTVFSDKVLSEYRVGLGALPQLAGKGTVYFEKPETKRTTEHVKNTYNFNGNSFYPEHWHTILQKIYPKDGWTVDVSKPPKMTVHHKHGDHQQEILTFSRDLIVLKVSLYCRSGSEIGIVDIDVEFEQFQDQRVSVSRTESFEMNWKDSQLLEPKQDESISKVVFIDYKGVTQAYGAPDISSGVLKIAAQGNGKWKIWAEAPKELNLRPMAVAKMLAGGVPQIEPPPLQSDFDREVRDFTSAFRTFCDRQNIFLSNPGWEKEFDKSEKVIFKFLEVLNKIEVSSETKAADPIHLAFEKTGDIVLEGDRYLGWRKWYGEHRNSTMNLIYFTRLVITYSTRTSLCAPNISQFKLSLTGAIRGLNELKKWYYTKYISDSEKLKPRLQALDQSLSNLMLIQSSIEWSQKQPMGKA